MFSSPVAVVLSTVWDALKEELEGEGKKERGRGRGGRNGKTPAENTCNHNAV